MNRTVRAKLVSAEHSNIHALLSLKKKHEFALGINVTFIYAQLI
jgi:hypothetical protein